MFVRKVGGSELADVGVQESEKEGAENNDDKSSKL